jgi:hypothetical protein
VERLAELRMLIASDRRRMEVLRFVRDLGLPDCWVAAGFVRNCVWDHLHGRATSPLAQDIDVIWFDPAACAAARDAALETALREPCIGSAYFPRSGNKPGRACRSNIRGQSTF